MTDTTSKLVQPGLFGGDPEPFGRPKFTRPLTSDLRPPTSIPPGELVQVAPGKWAMKGGPDPEHILAEVFRHPDGTLGFRPAGYGRLAKLTADLGTLLGFEGQLHTVRRLARAGFIRFFQPSPCVYLLDLDSWFAHLDATEEDPDFWDPEGPNLKRYLMANGLRV